MLGSLHQDWLERKLRIMALKDEVQHAEHAERDNSDVEVGQSH